MYYDFESFLKPYFKELPDIQKYQHFWFKRNESGKVFVQKEAGGEFGRFDILKNKHFDFRTPISIFSFKPLSLTRQEYLYKNIRKFVDELFWDITCPKPVVGRNIWQLANYILANKDFFYFFLLTKSFVMYSIISLNINTAVF